MINSNSNSEGGTITLDISDGAIGLSQLSGINRGSIIIGGINGDAEYLTIGEENKILTSNGNDIIWSNITNEILPDNSISNDKLLNNKISIGTSEVSLGSNINSINGLEGLTIDGSEGLILKNGTISSGFIEFYERSGTRKLTLKGPDTTDNIVLHIPPRGGNIITSEDIGTITNLMLNGGITNDKIENKTITIITNEGLINGGSVELGGSISIDVSVDNSSIEVSNNNALQIKSSGITNDMLSENSISNGKLVNNFINVSTGEGLIGGGIVNLGNSISLSVSTDDSSIEIFNNSLRVSPLGITNDMLLGSIDINKLNNRSITIGSTEITLGGSSTSFNGITSLVVDGSEGIKVKNGSNSAGFIEFYENSNNGNNKITLKGQESTNDLIINLPNISGTLLSSNDINIITNDMLIGSINTNKLSNPSISLGGVYIELGSSNSTPSFNLINSTGYKMENLNGTITNDQLYGSISNDKLVNNYIHIISGEGLSNGGTIELGSEITLDVDVDDNSIEINNNKLKIKPGGITLDMLSDTIDLTSKIQSELSIDLIPTIDEDIMSSNSINHVPTQRSVRSYIDISISSLVDSAPGTLDTLNELAAALGDNENFSTYVMETIDTVKENKLSKNNNLSDLTNKITARSNLNVDIAGTDNSTNVTLSSINDNYLSISGQKITAGIVPISLGGTGNITGNSVTPTQLRNSR